MSRLDERIRCLEKSSISWAVQINGPRPNPTRWAISVVRKHSLSTPRDDDSYVWTDTLDDVLSWSRNIVSVRTFCNDLFSLLPFLTFLTRRVLVISRQKYTYSTILFPYKLLILRTLGFYIIQPWTSPEVSLTNPSKFADTALFGRFIHRELQIFTRWYGKRRLNFREACTAKSEGYGYQKMTT